jgi:hypothetical protein
LEQTSSPRFDLTEFAGKVVNIAILAQKNRGMMQLIEAVTTIT